MAIGLSKSDERSHSPIRATLDLERSRPRQPRPGGSTPKGRRVEPAAAAELLALLGDSPRRRDLLIEYLHKIQDRYGCLQARHLVALANELKMAMAEVYEVATFYHHFDGAQLDR